MHYYLSHQLPMSGTHFQLVYWGKLTSKSLRANYKSIIETSLEFFNKSLWMRAGVKIRNILERQCHRLCFFVCLFCCFSCLFFCFYFFEVKFNFFEFLKESHLTTFSNFYKEENYVWYIRRYFDHWGVIRFDVFCRDLCATIIS